MMRPEPMAGTSGCSSKDSITVFPADPTGRGVVDHNQFQRGKGLPRDNGEGFLYTGFFVMDRHDDRNKYNRILRFLYSELSDCKSDKIKNTFYFVYIIFFVNCLQIQCLCRRTPSHQDGRSAVPHMADSCESLPHAHARSCLP